MEKLAQAVNEYIASRVGSIPVAKKHGISHTLLYRELKRLGLMRTVGESSKCRTHSTATREKISKSRSAYLKANPDKVPYRLNHSSVESYPEKYFREWLNTTGVPFKQEVYVSYYALDFVVGKIDLEIDGDQHILDKRIVTSNKKRDEFLAEQGYTVHRILWSSYSKLSQEERAEYLENLKQFLLNQSSTVPFIPISKRELAKMNKPKNDRTHLRKFNPSKEVLFEQWKSFGFNTTKVARIYNVSGSAVKKRLTSLGINSCIAFQKAQHTASLDAST